MMGLRSQSLFLDVRSRRLSPVLSWCALLLGLLVAASLLVSCDRSPSEGDDDTVSGDDDSGGGDDDSAVGDDDVSGDDDTASGDDDSTASGDDDTASVSGIWSTVSPDCSGAGTVEVDSAQSHSGSQSVRVDGAGDYCDHIFLVPSLPIIDLDTPIWVRFWVRFEQALGMEHVTFVAFHDQVDDRDLRLGGQSEVYSWNREVDDATLPSLSPTGIGYSTAPTPGVWTCLELFVDAPLGELFVSVDGSVIYGLLGDSSPTANVDQSWNEQRPDWAPELTDVKLGWESYGGASNTLWFDDVAVGTSPIGCDL